MSAFKDRRSGRWRYRRRIELPDGTRARIKGTPTENTKKAAEAAERDHVWRLQNPQAAAAIKEQSKEVPTLNEYAEIFYDLYGVDDKEGTREERKRMLKADVLPTLGGLRFNQLTQGSIDMLKKESLKKRGRKSTANVLSVLSSLVKYADRNGIPVPNRLAFNIKFSNMSDDVDVVPQEDIEALLGVACPRYELSILLGAEAGLRQGEIRALQWADIGSGLLKVNRRFDTKNRLDSTKGNKPRKVGISPRIRRALVKVERMRTSEKWILTLLGSARPLSYWAMRDGILRLYKLAAVPFPRQPWHSLRHSYGTAQARAGVPLEVIRKAMGHKRVETTLRYFHIDDDDLLAATLRVYGEHSATPKGPQLGPNLH